MYSIKINFNNPSRDKGGPAKYRIWWDAHAWGDFRFPFREVIQKLVDSLSDQYQKIELDTEEYWVDEDFIEFKILLESETIFGYFEHSLGYITLNHDDKAVLSKIRTIANQIEFESEGYEEGMQFYE